MVRRTERRRRLGLDPGTADRLVAGAVAPDDAPPGYARLAEVLQHLHTGLDGLHGGDLAGAGRTSRPARGRPPRLASPPPLRRRLAGTLAVSALLAGGTTGVLAATGSDEADRPAAKATASAAPVPTVTSPLSLIAPPPMAAAALPTSTTTVPSPEPAVEAATVDSSDPSAWWAATTTTTTTTTPTPTASEAQETSAPTSTSVAEEGQACRGNAKRCGSSSGNAGKGKEPH